MSFKELPNSCKQPKRKTVEDYARDALYALLPRDLGHSEPVQVRHSLVEKWRREAWLKKEMSTIPIRGKLRVDREEDQERVIVELPW